MLVSFLESFKYIGHLYPIAFLRILMGTFYLQAAFEKYYGDYLFEPQLAQLISHSLETPHAPQFFIHIMENYMLQYWKLFAYVFNSIEFFIGISFIIGYLVRPFSLLAMLLSINYMWIYSQDFSPYYNLLFAVNLSLCIFGAGRCLGVDYYFYKKMRGIWW